MPYQHLDKIRLLCIISLVVRVTWLLRRREDYANIDAYAAIEILIILVLAAINIFDPRIKQYVTMFYKTSFRYVVSYYLFGLLSAIWSLNPAVSAFRAFEVLVIIFTLFIYINNCSSFYIAERRFIKLGTIIILLDFIRVARGMDGFNLSGFHDAMYGTSAAILLIYFISKDYCQVYGSVYLITNIFCILMIILSSSSSVIIALLLSLFLGVFIVKTRVYKIISTTIFLLCLLIVLLGKNSIFLEIMFFNKSDGAIITGSGRTDIWKLYWEMFLNKPILGYGFSIGPRVCEEFYASNAHNYFFSALLGMGIGGILLLMHLVYKTMVSAWRLFKKDLSPCFFLTLVFVFLNNLTNAYIGEGFSTPTIVFIIFFSLMSYQEMRTYPIFHTLKR